MTVKIHQLIKWSIVHILNEAEPSYRTRSRSEDNWCRCRIEDDRRKVCGLESSNGDFPMHEVGKDIKIEKLLLWWLWYSSVRIDSNILRPTFVPNLTAVTWKKSPGMQQSVDSLKCPLCAYSMRKNLHNQTRPRMYGGQCPFDEWKWSKTNYRREKVNVRWHPPACLLGPRKYPEAS